MRATQSVRWPTRIVTALLFLTVLGVLTGAAPLRAQTPPSGAESAQAAASLSIEGSGGLAMPGGEATYHLHVVNRGDALQRQTTVTQTLPTGLSYIPGSAQVTVGGLLVSQTDPVSQAQTLAWGPFTVPAAGHTAHNSYGVHTFTQDLCNHEFIDLHLDQALALVGSGGYVTQLFYRITSATTGPDECAVYFVNAAYDRNLVPILRLQGEMGSDGIWVKPAPGSDGSYQEIAQAFSSYVAGLPLRNTHPLYVSIWNEPDLWIEWSNAPNAQQYGKFFVAVSNAIRALDDDRIRIMNAPTTPNNTAFLRGLLKVPGFSNAFDVWASHCYPYNHPPGYNIHKGTARYLNATIDCYVVDGAVIETYGGRSDFDFIVKETGYELGSNVYGFEGYPTVTESLRAQYAADAFNKNWRTWDELITATPYEMGDPWSGWENLDWIDYDISLSPFHFSYEPHAVYDRVAALAKPHGDVVPRSIAITFRAQVDPGMATGSYPSQLDLMAAGELITATETAAVHVTDVFSRTYLPQIAGGQTNNTWMMEVPAAMTGTSEDEDDGAGAIVPTRFLSASSGQDLGTAGTSAPVSLEFADRQAVAVTLSGDWWSSQPATAGANQAVTAYVALLPNELAVVSLTDMQQLRRLALNDQPLLVTPGSQSELVYAVTASNQLALLDATDGRVIARTDVAGQASDVVFDPVSSSLLLADGQGGTLSRFRPDLSVPPSVISLEDLPGRLLLDAGRRRLFVVLPGTNSVLRLNADTLAVEDRFHTVGGPILAAAHDAQTDLLYVLCLLSPRYRGLSVLTGDTLSQVALVAGSAQVPLQQTSSVVTLAGNRLMLADDGQLVTVSTTDFSVADTLPTEGTPGAVSLTSLPATGQVVWLSGNRLYRNP